MNDFWTAISNFFKGLLEFFKDPITPEVPKPPIITKDEAEKPDTFKSTWDELIYLLAIEPWPLHVKVARLAQWILESGRGTSLLSKEALNFGGLKWRPEMAGYAIPINIKVPSESVLDKFCKFESLEKFIDGYEVFMNRTPYKGTWQNQTTAEGYLKSISKIYAADENYAVKVSKLIGEAKTLLGVYLDHQEPPRPDNEPGIDLPDDEDPIIVQLKGTQYKYKTRGNYRTTTGNALGLVVHYTVSGRTQSSAKGVVAYLAKEGLGCPVMDEDGVIYIPEGFDILKHVAYHAGESAWKGKTGISSYCIGMEICNWGTDGAKKGVTDLRSIPANDANIKKGVYQKYTEKQEKALFNFCKWLKKKNPEFSVDWVVGHDEIAPKRKSDPGGSLSMNMPNMRNELKKFFA